MRELFDLGPRLQKCADFVREGSRFADIGTDHGYLPIWLVKTGRVKSAVAADIGEGPISAARKNAEKYHVEIKTVLSDGFKNIDPEEVEDAVIAGMGGGLISSIIYQAPWLRDESKRLILEPMTAIPELREFLAENGFEVIREDAVKDEGKVYSVMLVRFSGIIREPDPVERYMGKIIPHSDNSLDYARKTLNLMGNKSKGLEHNGKTEELLQMKKIMAEIEEKYL